MADKSFGVKEINLVGASGTPTIESPNNLNINAVNVAISTDITVGGMVSLGTGTSISSPATNVLTLGTNSVERVRIDSSGDILVSKTGAGNGSNTDVITLDNNNNNTNDNLKTSIAFKRTGNNSSYIYSRISSERIGTHDTDIVFATNYGGSLSEELRIKANGGITFNGDTAAANALDDYERGTWTPAINLSGTLTYSVNGQLGRYVKIGNTVYVSFHVRISSTDTTQSAAVSATVTGLPFTSANVSLQGIVPVMSEDATARANASAATFYGVYISSTSSNLQIVETNTNGTTPGKTYYRTCTTNIYSGGTLMISGQYTYQVS